MTDLGRRLRPGMPFLIGMFLLAGLSGVGTYGWAPLGPPAAALAVYMVVWFWHPARRQRPELLYAGAFVFGEAMLALALVLGRGPRASALVILSMPVLLAAVLFPRRVVVVATGYGLALMFAVTFGVNLSQVEAIPAVAYGPPVMMISLAVTGLVVRDLEEASRRSAFVDVLTGALNRAALAPRIAELTHQTKIVAEPVAVIIADIDHFKEINDHGGHVAGDVVLREIARRLSDCVSAFEPVYRLGGEEFLILLPGHDTSEARGVAQRMWSAVRESPVEGVAVTMSFGVASSSPVESLDFDAVFAEADRALYRAKRSGRDLVRVALGAGHIGVADEESADEEAVAEHAQGVPEGTRPEAADGQGSVAHGGAKPSRRRARGGWTRGSDDTANGVDSVSLDLEREHMIELNRRLATLFRVIALTAFLAIAGAIPQYGWHVLIAPILGAIPYYLLSRYASRFRNPSVALGLGWVIFQTSIALGFVAAEGAPLWALPLLALMVPGRCAVLRTRAAAVGTAYTALLIAGAAFYLDSSRVLENPSLVLFPIALVIEAGYVGAVVGGSAVGFRGAGILDDLTGLLNRSALGARLLELHAQAASVPHSVAIVVADLDHFKAVNDRAGHSVGDAVLREVAVRIRASLRTFDSAYRVGGEEFLVLLPDADTADALRVAERLFGAVRSEPCENQSLTVSIGVAATRPGERFAYEDVFGRADAALYEAKRLGRDRICVDGASRPQPSAGVEVVGGVGAAHDGAPISPVIGNAA